MDRFVVSDASVLAFAPHIVFRFDEVRQRWIILAPERLMLPDEQAVEILKLVDGKTGVSAIVDSLAARYQAPQDVDFALRYVKQHATTRADQEAVLAALRFKCDVLWAQLDALHFAYVDPGLIPPGAFVPKEQ